MEIGDRSLHLQAVSIEDAATLLPAYHGDAQFNHWIGRDIPMAVADVQRDMQATAMAPAGIIWRIADATDTLVGVAKTARLPSPDTAWLDLLLIIHAFQGKGYGTQAATHLETYFFSNRQVMRIALAVLTYNTRALTFWEKRGYMRGERSIDQDGDDVYTYVLPRHA